MGHFVIRCVIALSLSQSVGMVYLINETVSKWVIGWIEPCPSGFPAGNVLHTKSHGLIIPTLLSFFRRILWSCCFSGKDIRPLSCKWDHTVLRRWAFVWSEELCMVWCGIYQTTAYSETESAYVCDCIGAYVKYSTMCSGVKIFYPV